MRKNKKLLLASVAAMGALALGVGATSTFAWFQATAAAVTVQEAASITGSISVNKPSAEISNLKAKITFSVNTSNAVIGLSTWEDTTMKTYFVPSTLDTGANSTAIDAAKTMGQTIASPYDGYVALLPVTAVLSDTTAAGDKVDGHDEIWAIQLHDKLSVQKTVTFTCATAAAGTSSALGSSEIYFYCASGNSTPTYAKGSEDTTGSATKTQALSVTVGDLVNDNGTKVTSLKDPVTIGYLCVRLEGTLRVHTAASYSVDLTATAS